jgi:hypothetical protein
VFFFFLGVSGAAFISGFVGFEYVVVRHYNQSPLRYVVAYSNGCFDVDMIIIILVMSPSPRASLAPIMPWLYAPLVY